MPVNQNLFDELLDSVLNIFRLAAQQRSIAYDKLILLERELVARIAAEAVTTRQKRRVETFLKETGAAIDKHFKQLQLEFDWVNIARYVASDTVTSFELALGIHGVHMPAPDYFKALKSDIMIMNNPAADWWRGQSEQLKRNFSQQVRQGLSGGETNQQIISRIVGKNGQPGIMDTARRNAAALVQTGVQAVANDARRNTFLANPDVIKGIRQVSTLDGHTSITCIAYSECEWDLEFKPIGKKKLPYNGGTPRHFNCRSVEVPITKTFAELGLNIPEPKPITRASSDGQIDANTSFNDFLKRKGKAYQDSMLGVGRADMWRQGKITLKDLVDGNGRPKSLAQLQAELDTKRARRKR